MISVQIFIIVQSPLSFIISWSLLHCGHEFEQTPEDSEGQGSLVCYSPRGCKELDTIEWLNNYQS